MTEIQEWYKNILENLHDGVYLVNTERRIEYWNKGAERITGFSAQEVGGRFCHENLLNHVTENGTQLCLNGCPLHATLQDGKPRTAEIFLQHADGHRVPVLVRTMPIQDEGGVITGAVEVFNDNSALANIRRQVRQLEQTNQMDAVTGIGNRRYIERKIRQAIRDSGERGSSFGLLFLDIDHFKQINDRWGHELGDRMLRQVAAILQRNLRAEDAVGRWGGEEFIVLLAEINQANMTLVAEKLRRLLAQAAPRRSEANVHLTVTIGATLLRAEDRLATAVRRADRIMYQGKALGRNRVCTEQDLEAAA